MKAYKGQCLCGDIQYQVTKIEERMGHCHCKMCRKFHGAAFATFGEAKAKNFKWVKGEDLLQSYQAKNGSIRQFCQKCGSSMTFKASNDDGKLIEFTLGTLDTDLDLQPDAHIFIASKANWFVVCDGLPKYEGYRSTKRLK
ncbi:MAG: GFA family protein [Cocleimonas sp.]